MNRIQNTWRPLTKEPKKDPLRFLMTASKLLEASIKMMTFKAAIWVPHEKRKQIANRFSKEEHYVRLVVF